MRHTTTAGLFQHSMETTDRWLTELMRDLEWPDRHKAYTALRATLQALREHVPVDECAQLSAQLPLVVRGIFWEGWNPKHDKTPKDYFLTTIHAAFKHDPSVDPQAVAKAVFAVLAKEISPGEFDDVRSALPHALRRFMPGPTPAAVNQDMLCGEPVASGQGAVSAVRWGAY